MERISIIPGDKTITVDGETYVCEFSCGEKVHAIQWFGDHGQIEVAGGPARGFVDLAMVEPFYKAWKVGRAKTLRAQCVERQSQIVEHAKILDSHNDAITQMTGDIANLNQALEEGSPEDPTRPVMIATRDRLAAQMNRAAREIAVLEAMRASFEDSLIGLGERARQAEAEIA